MEIKNLKKASDRIKKAIKDKENIVLYGDADLDGTTSVLVLEETVKNLGGKVAAIYFPDRESEGYGLGEIGLDYLKKFAPALRYYFPGNFSVFNKRRANLQFIVFLHQ